MQEDKEKEMTKDVVVSLKGLQLAPDQQSDAVEVIAPGEYESIFDSGKYEIKLKILDIFR